MKYDILEGVDKQKGLLLLREVLHLIIPINSQFGERGKEQAMTNGCSSESSHIIYFELLQFGGTGWNLLFMHL
jgi:hypothetical protein